MTIYFDFDGTIFNTTKMYNDFTKLFKKYKITKEEINNILTKTIPQGQFNLERLANEVIKEYNLDSKTILDKTRSLYLKDYVYSDVEEYLKLFKNDFKLVLLTCGDTEYQEIKINMAKLSKYFDDIIITKVKDQVDKVNYKEGIFIDNTPRVLNLFKDAGSKCLIRVKRLGDWHYTDESEIDYFTVSKFNKKMYDYIIKYVNIINERR